MMKTFAQSTHKIRLIWENSQANANEISRQQSINEIKNKQVELLNPTNTIFSKVLDYTTAWTPMPPAFQNVFGYPSNAKIMTWEISATVPESVISLAKWDIEYRAIGDPITGSRQISYFIVVNDVVGSNTLKNVNWIFGWELVGNDLEVRLRFTLPNPNLFL